MRELSVNVIEKAVEKLYIDANLRLSDDVVRAQAAAMDRETNPRARDIFAQMQENLKIADTQSMPICQDTGMAIVFIDVGQDVHLTDGSLTDAVNRGVAAACEHGYLRASVVADPIRRVNTGTNAPAILHTRLIDGDRVRLTVMPKGFGSENMSALRMLKPSVTREDILDTVTELVRTAGANPCPPVFVGVGLGGDAEYACELAKRALLRSVDVPNADPFYAEMERELLRRLNGLNIGAQGFGGDITAFHAAIEVYPTHIAGLPCAVNIGCHVTRHAEITL